MMNLTLHNKLLIALLLACLTTNTSSQTASKRPTLREYTKQRNALLEQERSKAFGSDLILNAQEIEANGIIMKAKNAELNTGFLSPRTFNPSKDFLSIVDRLNSSKLYDFIHKLPKGGILHAHDAAMASGDFMISLTYWENLWITRNTIQDGIAFRFSRATPTLALNGFGPWILVAEERKAKGVEAFDAELRGRFSLHKRTEYDGLNEVWTAFRALFGTTYGLILYEPAWRAYLAECLKEAYEDNVSYIEFRSSLPTLYDLDGKTYTVIDSVHIMEGVFQQFVDDHPDFVGGKLIYAPSRHITKEAVEGYINTTIALKAQFPNFIGGFDLVGQEDNGFPLIDFAEELLSASDDLNYFFHAGETNWNGLSTDENLIDAILIGTKRIGHGYGLLKHPAVMDAIRRLDIAIEINPISNQVLFLVDDLRNHPAAYLLANNFSVVVSSDDPSYWRAKPLTDDFYLAFLGIASAHADLRVLKLLAINSFKYSTLSEEEKVKAFAIWNTKWDSYIQSIAKNED